MREVPAKPELLHAWILVAAASFRSGRAGHASVLDALSRMNTLLGSRRARLAVVALPTSDQVYAQEPRGQGFDISLPQAAVQEFCADMRIPYLDLLPLLRQQAMASNRRLYLKSDTHLNDFGHSRVGQLIADWFQSRVKRP